MAEPEDRTADEDDSQGENHSAEASGESDGSAGESDGDRSVSDEGEEGAPADDSEANGDAGESDDEGEGGDEDEDAGEDDDAGEDEDEDEETDESEEASEGDDAGEDEDEAPAPLPPMEPAPFVELMAAYRQPATAGAERLPWSWATLSPAEREANAAVLDGFVESYNQTWAISEEQVVPSCWHRHPALAHDLAALAWAYFQAYRDPTATPDLAMRLQSHLVPFAERVDRWLGADPGECRAGRHPVSWRSADRVAGSTRGTNTVDEDAVVLLGRESFGFAPSPPPAAD